MFVVAKRILKQILHDRRSVAIIVIAPIMMLTLIFFLLGKSSYKPTVALDKASFSPAVADALESGLKDDSDIVFSLMPDGGDPRQLVEDQKADAVISAKDQTINIVMLELVPAKLSIVRDALKAAVPKSTQSMEVSLDLVHGSENESTFDSLTYYMLCVLSFFFIFLFAGISFVRERTQGTLERLMRTPIKSTSVVTGYTLGFGFFAAVQSVLMILYTKFILKASFAGPLWLTMLIMLLTAMIAVLMGIFISVISKSEFQVVQFIPIFIVPQIFFSGLIPVDMLPYHLNYISYIMPLYYCGVALKYVMTFGYGFGLVAPHLGALAAFIAVLFPANVWAVQRSRRS